MSDRPYQLGVIGGGNMAEAIVRPAIDAGVLQPGRVIIADPVAERRELFAAMGAKVTDDNQQVIDAGQQIMLAIKPQQFPALAEAVGQITANEQIVISIMAGIPTARIADAIGDGARVVRVMPNTPLMVGLGMSGVCVGKTSQDGDDELAMKLFGVAGVAVRIDEDQMDAVTAVSGSGPAYVFYLAEAMAEAAKQLKLPDDAIESFVRQTVRGAAELLSRSPESAAELRRRVTSPGGTTQAAIEHMEATGVREHIAEALHKAAKRSKELGRGG